MEKFKSIFSVIIIILIIIAGILLYPFKVSTDENGNEHCTNLIGVEFNCKEKNNP